ncbi:melanotransferrin-like isoform X1 [Orbicella faveolata]|uniref:melanotransferrin-like isoform X1 n=1 Tax=Orbicella faveolata TaxID=48498 RepID=UPI0009E226FB|nr:melanotransferrin-like isoform X1 [Orbicella faveolata]
MAKTLLAFLALLTIQYAFAGSISFKWCALPKEKAKCLDFIKYANITARNVSLEVAVECVHANTHEECITKIKSGQADLVTLDGGDLYEAGKDDNLVPIVGEQYGEYGVKYYGVAVVKKNNKGFTLKTLKGRTSCHTGARRTAGWNVPVGYLLRTGIMAKMPCKGGGKNYDLKAASKFFSESCVPGANALLEDEASKYKNLCELCAGTGTDKCTKDSSKNRYVGYHGAFKCMGDGKGDVAFVKHTTTQEVVDDGGYGKVDDYEYLCRNGTRISVAGKAHESCNLGNNPGHAVVTRKSNNKIGDIITILTTMSDRYGSNQKNWTNFQLFNSTKYSKDEKVSNLLFKDSTTELKAIPSEMQNYNDYLGKDYGQNREAMASCTTSPTVSTSCTVAPIIELVLLIALLGAAQHFL